MTRAHLDDYGHYSVQIERQVDGKRRTVDVTLHLQAATVQVYPNKDLSPARHKTQPLSAGRGHRSRLCRRQIPGGLL